MPNPIRTGHQPIFCAVIPDLKKRTLAAKLLGVSNSSSRMEGALSKQDATKAAAQEHDLKIIVGKLLKLMNKRLSVASKMAQGRWNDSLPGEDQLREKQILDQIQLAMPDAVADTQVFVRRFFQGQFKASELIQNEWFEEWGKRAPFYFRQPHDLAQLREELDALTLPLLSALREVQPMLERDEIRQYISLREWELTSPALKDNTRHHVLNVLIRPPLNKSL